MSKTSILHVVGPTHGGIKQYVKSLIYNMDKSSFSILIACNFTEEDYEELSKNGIKYFHINARNGRFAPAIPGTVFFLKNIINDNPIDIIHSHGLKATFLVVTAINISRKTIPIVYTAHSDIPFEDCDKVHSLFYKGMEKLIIGHATAIVTVSKTLEKQIIKRIPKIKTKTRTIYAGVPMDRIEDKSFNLIESFKKNLRLDEGQKKVIGTIARLAPQKGIDYFIMSIKHIIHKHPKAHFIIAGEGQEEEKLMKLTLTEGISKHVCFLDYIENVASLYHIIDIFVLPSITEGLPLTIIEALMAGKPIVATSVGGIPEIIKDNKTGLLVSPAEPYLLAKAIIKLLENEGLGHDLAMNGREFALNNFRLNTMISRYSKLYKEVIEIMGEGI